MSARHGVGRPAKERVILPGTTLELSPLGFGTSALMSRVNRRDSLQLLHTAFDEGITHFDTARSYGFGEAELAVGDLLALGRDRFTVTTKVGILPPQRSAALSAAKAFARGTLSLFPAVRAQVRQRAGKLVQAGCFDAASMARSLEASLRHLRTDYVDLLLLHEPTAEVLAINEPLAFLQRVQREGKVRFFGLAAAPEVAAYALQYAPAYAEVVQLPRSVFLPALEARHIERGAVVSHSALSSPLPDLRAALAGDNALAARWSRELQVDVTTKGWLERLALQWCLADLPAGTVVFTSTNPAHIRQNAAAQRTAASSEQLHRFAQLAQGWLHDR